MSYSDSWSPYATVYDPVKVGSIDGTDIEPHDHGLVRACSSTYHPIDPSREKCSKKTLFVARLDKDVTEKDLDNLFGRFGSLKSATVVRDIVTGFSKHYGFIEFADHRDCRTARRETHQTQLKGKQILVDWEWQHSLPGWIPRRLGGGFGGKKESGQLRFGCLDRPWKKPLAIQYSESNHTRHQRDERESRSSHLSRRTDDHATSSNHHSTYKLSYKDSQEISRKYKDDECGSSSKTTRDSNSDRDLKRRRDRSRERDRKTSRR